MKKTLLILIICVMVTSALTSDEVQCKQLFAFTVCDQSGVLTFVNQTGAAESLNLNVDRFSSTAPNAFQNLRVDALSLEFRNRHEKPKIMNFSEDSFKGLPTVSWLVVEHLIFPLKPNPFRDLRQLTFLSLNGCGLTEVPELVADFPHLSMLWLVNSNITSITRDSFAGVNENMETILLEGNKISTVDPTSFHKFKNLQRLSLESNELASIVPGTFDGLKQLENLKLGSNNLTAIRRETFRGLSHLKTLSLEFNQISEIEPLAFAGLNVQSIALSRNNLQNLQPGIFDNLTRLENLHLDYNKIHTIPNNVFNGLTKLQWLYLRWNEIGQIEPHAFSGLVLMTLDLQHNRLTVLEPGTLSDLNVTTLDLSENEINQIKPQALANLTVQKIVLENNKVDSVDRDSWGLEESVRVIGIN